MKYIEEIREGERISAILLCKHKQSAVTKNGRPYENLILQDKTGTLDAKIWEPDSQGIDSFEALDYMTNQIEKRSFDVALLGCGAYGFPLASRIKNMGKQAIHMGGALQILFGIRGGRWDSHPIISKLYNENWVRPKLTERPQNFNQVENGCYW